jgi:pimeloyl-ACP methyl ester carboxylesterase
VLIVWGDEDKVVPRSAAEVWTRSLPNARLEIIKNCGHAVEMEKPEELLRLIGQIER